MSSKNTRFSNEPLSDEQLSQVVDLYDDTNEVSEAPNENDFILPQARTISQSKSSLYTDDFDESELTGGATLTNVVTHDLPSPDDELLGEGDVMELIALAREDNVMGQSHQALVGLDAGTQCAILWKSLMQYLQNNPTDYAALGSWPSKIVKAIPSALKNDPTSMAHITIIPITSFYTWKAYASNVTVNIKRYGCSYNLASKELFSKFGKFMVSDVLEIDTTYFPYYVPYQVKSKLGGGTNYNEMPKFEDGAGRKFSTELVLLYLYSYALIFKCRDKKFVLEPITFNGSVGNIPTPSFIAPSQEVTTIFKQWTPPVGVTVVGAFHHFIAWSLTAKYNKTSNMSGPLYPMAENGMWIGKNLYEIAARYPVSHKILTVGYIAPAALLDTMRKVRDGTILDQGWCKDSDQGGFTLISEGKDAGKYCVNRTVINKCLVPLKLIIDARPDYVLYGGVAGSGNYQTSYMHTSLEAAQIPMITFDKVARANVQRVDATDPADIIALYGAVPKKSKVIFYCDIDFAGQNDNKKPVKIINEIYDNCPPDINLMAVFHKGTLLANIPMTQRSDVGVKFVRDENKDYVTGRKHNAEGVLVGMRELPHAEGASAVDPRVFDHPRMSVPAIRWLEKFFKANIFRGMDVPIGRMDGTKLKQFSALPPKQLIFSDVSLQFNPIADERVKVKVDNAIQIPDELSGPVVRVERVVARNVLRAIMPAGMSGSDIEYYCKQMLDGYGLRFAAVAHDSNTFECDASSGNELSAVFVRNANLARE